MIEDDASGDVETSGTFDPAADGIDFYESLEGMRVQLNDAVAVGPRNAFGEIPVVGDDGTGASVRTARGGLVIGPADFNPERVMLDDSLLPTPVVDVGDHFTSAAVGVLDYSFNNFKLNITAPVVAVDGGLAKEATTPAGPKQTAIATLNVPARRRPGLPVAAGQPGRRPGRRRAGREHPCRLLVPHRPRR